MEVALVVAGTAAEALVAAVSEVEVKVTAEVATVAAEMGRAVEVKVTAELATVAAEMGRVVEVKVTAELAVAVARAAVARAAVAVARATAAVVTVRVAGWWVVADSVYVVCGGGEGGGCEAGEGGGCEAGGCEAGGCAHAQMFPIRTGELSRGISCALRVEAKQVQERPPLARPACDVRWHPHPPRSHDPLLALMTTRPARPLSVGRRQSSLVCSCPMRHCRRRPSRSVVGRPAPSS